MPVTCWIYKSLRKEETYLYLARPDDFARVPDELLNRMGRLQLVMDLQLDADTRLARADAREVISNLETRGYHLQLPPTLRPALYYGD